MTVSLYRKYRPQTFDEVVGQSLIEQTLRNAIINDNVSHAYLFCGPRGTGKTTTARLLAKALLCEKGPTADPCGVCEQCTDIASGVHPDVYELDAASRTGVDNVREEIISRVAFSPTRGRYKVYIIDEVHMLSTPAFNALLKTLEEPPDHIVFILCTTDPHKVPETIQSRCQRFDFHRIADADIILNLHMICTHEGIKADDEVLGIIARHSQGGMRDAITTLEQLSVFTGGDIHATDADGLFGEVKDTQIHAIVALIAARDIAGCFRWVAAFVEGGTDIAQFTRDLTGIFRDLYVLRVCGDENDLIGMSPNEIKGRTELAAAFAGPERLARILLILSELGAELRTSTDQRLSLEIALTRMAHPTADLTLEALAERVEALEEGTPLTGLPAPAVLSGGLSDELFREQPAQVADRVPAQRQTVSKADVPAQRPPVSKADVPAQRPPVSKADVVAQRPPVSKADVVAGNDAEVSTGAPTGGDRSSRAEGHSADMLDQSTLSRLWAVASKEIQGQRKSLAGLIAIVRPHLNPQGGINLELPEGSQFSKRMMETPENQRLIREAIESAFGEGIPYVITISTEKPMASPMPFEATDSVELFDCDDMGRKELADLDTAMQRHDPIDTDDDDEYVYEDDASSDTPETTPVTFDDPSVPGMFSEDDLYDAQVEEGEDSEALGADIGASVATNQPEVLSFGAGLDDDGSDEEEAPGDVSANGADAGDETSEGFAPLEEMDRDLADMIFGSFSQDAQDTDSNDE